MCTFLKHRLVMAYHQIRTRDLSGALYVP
jgi:hypothetical protein